MRLFMSKKILIRIIDLISNRLNKKRKVNEDEKNSLVLKNQVLTDLKQLIITIMEDHFDIQPKKKNEVSLKNIPENQLRLILIGLKFLNEPDSSPDKVRLKKIISFIKNN